LLLPCNFRGVSCGYLMVDCLMIWFGICRCAQGYGITLGRSQGFAGS
jgi:hypothetical protein